MFGNYPQTPGGDEDKGSQCYVLEPAKTEVHTFHVASVPSVEIVQRFSRSGSQKPYSEPKPATGNKVAKPFFHSALMQGFFPWYLKLRPQLWLIKSTRLSCCCTYKGHVIEGRGHLHGEGVVAREAVFSTWAG